MKRKAVIGSGLLVIAIACLIVLAPVVYTITTVYPPLAGVPPTKVPSYESPSCFAVGFGASYQWLSPKLFHYYLRCPPPTVFLP
ncbi:MAG: hypothetical protein M1587_09915 [Thaumarchaeota archaeon]|nr:hypothetical protein [Nitrososphaerota archaeon]